MIHAIRAISSYSDPEYQRIIQELRKLGITPSGDPGIDRTKLNQEKAELLKKIQSKEEEKFSDNFQSDLSYQQDSVDSKRAIKEEQIVETITNFNEIRKSMLD